MSKDYTVITSSGYWGKGETPVEAARNANVRSKAVNGTLYHSHDLIDGEIHCTGFGGTEWTWHKDMVQLKDEELFTKLRVVAHNAARLASGEMRITKGKLVVKCEFEK